MWLPVLIIALTGFYIWLKWNYNYWRKRGVAGPKPTFIFGNTGQVLSLQKQFGVICDEWYKKFDDQPYIGYYKNYSPAIMARDCDLVKNILIKDFNSFSENELQLNESEKSVLGHNPFVLSGERWKSSRASLSNLFTSSKIKVMHSLMNNACDKLQDYITKNGPSADLDSKDLAARFTTQNIAYITFSLDAECFETKKSEFRIMGKKIFAPTLPTIVRLLILEFFPFLYKVIPISFIPKEVENWIINVVKKNVESRKNLKLSHDDLLQLLLNYQEKNSSISDEEVTGHAFSCFLEGYETSSTMFCFAMYELARHPDMQERMYEEIIEVLDKNNNELTYDSINQMEYLDCILQETLRLRPVALTLNKVCTKSYEMPICPGEKSPLIIKKGTMVVIPVYSLHMDPKYYPEPEIFNPERFTADERKARHKGVFIPFGEGPRMCPGIKFAFAQIKIALATVTKNFKIKISPNCKPFELDQQYFLYQSKFPLLLNFEPRKK